MKIISYMDFLLEGKRADAIQSLTAKYNGNKEQALQDITHVEQQMLQMFNNQGLVNKYIYSVMNFIESSDNTGHSHEDSIRNVLNDMKRLIDWEPRMKQQGKQLLVDQLDKMSWIQFNGYLNDFYDEQPHDKWKSKYTKEINLTQSSGGNDYEIVHIPNWDTAKRYMGDKLTWCVTQSENAFLGYTTNGTIFIFAFNPNYDSLGSYDNDKGKLTTQCDPTDEFALSALAIRVHTDGKITVTCRYNHEGGCSDDVYSTQTVEILTNLGIYSSIEPILKERERLLNEKLDAVKKIFSEGINPETLSKARKVGVKYTYEIYKMILESDLYHEYKEIEIESMPFKYKIEYIKEKNYKDYAIRMMELSSMQGLKDIAKNCADDILERGYASSETAAFLSNDTLLGVLYGNAEVYHKDAMISSDDIVNRYDAPLIRMYLYYIAKTRNAQAVKDNINTILNDRSGMFISSVIGRINGCGTKFIRETLDIVDENHKETYAFNIFKSVANQSFINVEYLIEILTYVLPYIDLNKYINAEGSSARYEDMLCDNLAKDYKYHPDIVKLLGNHIKSVYVSDIDESYFDDVINMIDDKNKFNWDDYLSKIYCSQNGKDKIRHVIKKYKKYIIWNNVDDYLRNEILNDI